MSILMPTLIACYNAIPHKNSTTTKVVLVSVGAGAALYAVLSRYLRRRRKPTGPPRRPRKYTTRRTRQSMRSPNDLLSLAGSRASARSGSPSSLFPGMSSDRLSIVSGSVGNGAMSAVMPTTNGAPQLTVQQLGAMGLEALETAINYWEDALNVHEGPRGKNTMLTTTTEASEFCREIQNLLEMSYALQEQSELLFLDQRSVLFRDEREDDGRSSQHESMGEVDRFSQRSVRSSVRSQLENNVEDCADSFASALDQVADLREFDGFVDVNYDDYPFFQAALKYNEECTVQCRSLRTEFTNCINDTEYLAKLHCIRQAFDYLFKDESFAQWICDTGRQILTDLLCLGDKDTKDFLVGYEDLINFVQNPSNWPCIQDEMESRNVKAMTFYDICVDFIILDSLQDLDTPPGSVVAVVQNRWLSNGFKESAIATAVWSVLKAKRCRLKYPNGFMSHFYVITEQISPLMAWGFFGPNENLREMCYYFRDQLRAFLDDIYSFEYSRYTTLEEFAADVRKHMQTRVNNIGTKFSQ